MLVNQQLFFELCPLISKLLLLFLFKIIFLGLNNNFVSDPKTWGSWLVGYQLQVFGIYVDLYCVVVIAVSEVKMSRQTALLALRKAFRTVTKVPNFVSTMSRAIKCNHYSKLFIYQRGLCAHVAAVSFPFPNARERRKTAKEWQNRVAKSFPPHPSPFLLTPSLLLPNVLESAATQASAHEKCVHGVRSKNIDLKTEITRTILLEGKSLPCTKMDGSQE